MITGSAAVWPPMEIRISGSGIRRARAPTGRRPSIVTAALTTSPPASKQSGGVSLQPPARSIRAAASATAQAPMGSGITGGGKGTAHVRTQALTQMATAAS
eukprot:scaffold42270_cov30-Tisochrysis_lutea.AAC.3